MALKINSRGQVTIFVVLAVMIVVAIVGVIFLRTNIKSDFANDLGARQAIVSCVETAVKESTQKIFDGGGEIFPEKFIMYDGLVHNYLCYQDDFYSRCYNRFPLLEESIENQIREDTKEEVQNCFNVLRSDFEERGYKVSGGSTDYSIDLVPGKVKINLKKRVEVVGEKSSSNFENFDGEVLSSLYELLGVAREIVNDESRYCNFEYNGYMILYPRFDIRRISYIDSRIYLLIDRNSGEEFRFAVRSCALPAGL